MSSAKILERQRNQKHVEHAYTLWRKYNKKYFEGLLTEPKIVVESSMDCLGSWIPKTRHKKDFPVPYETGQGTIKIYEKLFEDKESLGETLLHEMCHQAVSHSIHMLELSLEGPLTHGPIWKEYASRCGIRTSAYAGGEISIEIDETPKHELDANSLKKGQCVEANVGILIDGQIGCISQTVYILDTESENVYCLYVDDDTSQLMLAAVFKDMPICKPFRNTASFLRAKVIKARHDGVLDKVLNIVEECKRHKGAPLFVDSIETLAKVDIATIFKGVK